MIRIFLFVCFVIHSGSFALAQENAKSPSPPQADKNSEKEHFKSGRSLAQQKRYEDAVREFQQAIEINSKNNRYYDNLGFCLNKLGRYDEAVQALATAMSLNPRDAYAYRESAISYCGKKDFSKAVDLLQQSISLNSADSVSQHWLAYALYRVQNYDAAIEASEEALKLNSEDFDANYWRGLSFLKLNRFEEASQSLGTAVKIRSNDFNANFWTGTSFARQRKFKEATSYFEKAREIKPDDTAVRLELFGCYLATQQVPKAFEIFPFIARAVGLGLIGVYAAGIGLLLPFSLPKRTLLFPGFWFSIAWLALLVEGQVAFFLLLPLLVRLGSSESGLLAAALAGIPMIIVAATGFGRQPWGEPFRWPPQFGSPKIIMTSLSLLLLTVLVGGAFAQIYVQLTHKPFPLQRVIPLIKDALQSDPVLVWVTIGLAIPVTEEILFRGLLFGAFQKWWGVTGAIVGSALLFAGFHLQLIGFLQLFCLGLILGWARSKSGSLGLPVLIHALNNSLVTLALTFIPS